jgi:hypothetical protein
LRGSRWCHCYYNSGLSLIKVAAWQQLQLLHPQSSCTCAQIVPPRKHRDTPVRQRRQAGSLHAREPAAHELYGWLQLLSAHFTASLACQCLLACQDTVLPHAAGIDQKMRWDGRWCHSAPCFAPGGHTRLRGPRLASPLAPKGCVAVGCASVRESGRVAHPHHDPPTCTQVVGMVLGPQRSGPASMQLPAGGLRHGLESVLRLVGQGLGVAQGDPTPTPAMPIGDL